MRGLLALAVLLLTAAGSGGDCDILVPVDPGQLYRVDWAPKGVWVRRLADGHVVFRGPDVPRRARMVGPGALQLTFPCGIKESRLR